MTDGPDNQNDGAELERVKAKNRELLAELKQVKARAQELTEMVTAQAGKLRVYEVDGPAAQIFDEVFVPGTQDAARALLEQHARLEASDDGQLIVRDTKGEPVMLPAIPGKPGREIARECRATASDIRALVDTPELRGKFAAITVASRASGGGAGGHSSPGVAPRSAKPPQEPRQEPKLGLR